MPSRILYVSQVAEITTSDNAVFYFPIQSANCEFTRPVEDVLTFGLLGAVTRLQNAVSTCRSTIKTYLSQLYNTGYMPISQEVGVFNNTFNAAFVSKLTGDALNGNMTVINVQPNGFIMSGILARLGVDVANGSLGMADMEFVGVGEPYFYPTPVGIIGTQGLTGQLTTVSPVNNGFVSCSVGIGCANSLKFTLDIPNDVISCLGTNPSGGQGAISGSYVMVSRAPFKTNLVVEGASVDPSIAGSETQVYWFGGLGISLPHPVLVNRSFNQAANTAAASYSFTIDDISCIFY